jgi:hypothetical protein
VHVLNFWKKAKHSTTTNFNKSTTMLKPPLCCYLLCRKKSMIGLMGLRRLVRCGKHSKYFMKVPSPCGRPRLRCLRGQLDRFVMLDDETPQEMYNRLKRLVNKVRAYGSKRWNNRLVVKRLVRAYTIRDITIVFLIRGDPNYRRITLDDVLARIINHEMLLEEARYVENLSKGIVSIKKNDIALTASKKCKKK